MNTPAYLRLALALALSACRTESTVPTGPTVEVSVDDAVVRRVAVDKPVALATLVTTPIRGWLAVQADTTDDRSIDLVPRGGAEIRLFLDQGRPAIGSFPTVTSDMSPEIAALARQPTASLAGIASVRVLTKRPVLPPIAVEVDGTAHTVAGETLRGLTAISERHAQGWRVVDVIKLASERPVTAFRVVGATTLTVDPLDPDRHYLLKLNRRGEYVFRVWEHGARTPLTEARRVAKIVVP